MKSKIPSLSYNVMFKAVISNNKYILSKLVEAILNYYKIDIDINGKELTIKRNELNISNYQDRQLICDYVIKIDDEREINIEINRSKYAGLSIRNLTYSFKIFYEHFSAGDNYQEFDKYTLLQVNFNNYANPNNETINRYYMIDAEDVENKLSNNFSIMNIDIAKCHKIVYNKDNLEEISELVAWGAIIACDYLEDISSILERGIISMDKKEQDKFLDDVKEASKDKEVWQATKLENSIEDRFKWVEDIIRERTREETRKETTKEVTKQKNEEYAIYLSNMIKNMLKKNMSYNDISEITGKSIKEIKDIAKKV